jgi:hypothetical protein
MLPTSKATCMQHEHPRDARVESTGCSERVCRARLSQMCQRQASRSQPVASELSIMPLDVSACCGVRISAAPATLARVQRACGVLSARVCSCARRSAANAGVAVARRSPVRDMHFCACALGAQLTRFSVATELCVPIVLLRAAAPRPQLPPCCSALPGCSVLSVLSVLLRAVRAAPCALLQPPQRHGAQKNDAIRKSQEAAKQNGSVSSFSAQGRSWHTRSFFREL